MAAIEGGMKCIKYLLFAFNLIFAVRDLRLQNTILNSSVHRYYLHIATKELPQLLYD